MLINALRKSATGGVVKLVVFGLLMMAVGGMVFMDVKGFFRNGGVSHNDVAKIGSETISLQQFDRMARRTLHNANMTPQQAYEMGYMREMLDNEIRARLLAQKARDLGISPGPQTVVEKVQDLIAPMLAPGQQAHEVLPQILKAQGLSEQELSYSIKRDMSVGILGDAVQSGFADVSNAMVNDLALYEKEQRAVEFIVFADADFTKTKDPQDSELQTMYEATKEAYASPELRTGQLIILDTASLKKSLEITDEDLREAYERNKASYEQPETRTLEMTVLDDPAQAKDVAEKVKTGQSLKDATKAVTGRATDFIAAREYTQKDLDEALAKDVFAAKQGDLIGPVETGLGQQVLLVKAITPAQTKTLESVKEDLRKELEESKLADAQFELANSLDDALASGTTPDEIKNQFADAQIKDLPAMNSLGQDAQGQSALGEYKGLGDKLLRNLFELNEGEASSVFDMPDGRIAALVLKTITPKTYKPFEEVKNTLRGQWLDATRKADNKLEVMKILAEAKAENQDLKDIAAKYKKQVKNLAGLVRTKEPSAPLNSTSIASIFEAHQGDLQALDVDGGAAIVRITAINATQGYSAEEMAKARPNIVRSLQNESYQLLLGQTGQNARVKINESLLEQAYAAKQDE